MLIMPKSWWQLPFAGALLYHAKVSKSCQLCGVNPCQSVLKKGINPHWFNNLPFFCHSCHQSIAWQQSNFQIPLTTSQSLTGIASTFYEFPFNHIITKFKNSHDLTQLLPLIYAIRQLDVPTGCNGNNSAIIIVPTTKKRLVNRGFSPLHWLSLYLSFHWQIPIFNNIVREDRQHQQGLSRDERLINVQNAFKFEQLPMVQNLILFDDVVTTGATLQSIITSLAQQNRQQTTPLKYKLFARAILHGHP